MRSRKKKSMEQLTSTLMALMMAVTTTMSPVITLASELESSMEAVESQIEETTAEESTAEPSTVVVQSETAVQAQTDTETTALQAVSSDEASEVETKTDASTEAETVSNLQRGRDNHSSRERSVRRRIYRGVKSKRDPRPGRIRNRADTRNIWYLCRRNFQCRDFRSF